MHDETLSYNEFKPTLIGYTRSPPAKFKDAPHNWDHSGHWRKKNKKKKKNCQDQETLHII